MSLASHTRNWVRIVYFFGQNTLTVIGAVFTTTAALTMLAFWIYDVVLPGPPHPYIGVLIFLILPGVFVAGLLLVPVGIWIRRRKLRLAGKVPHEFPAVDFGLPVVRRTMFQIAFVTAINLIILGTASYRGVAYMDSTEFCGSTCHTPMEPEFTAYQNSPHSRVNCVECHIGPGAGWFVRSKLSGVRQVFAVTFHTYSTPIPSPVKYLRPARETCEQCHWPQRFTGDKLVIHTSYKDDEKNTPQVNVLLMRIGGRAPEGSVGIHGRHLADHSRIHYVSIDAARQVIPVVDYIGDDGKAVHYVSSDVKSTPQQLEQGDHREMDCIDCHNRPTHAFDLPERAVDNQMAIGQISPELPFIKKKAIEVLKVDYTDRDQAHMRIVSALTDFYRGTYPAVYQSRQALVQQSAEGVAAVYLRNVFPAMKLTWGSHPNNLGHTDFPGCFRCHDGNHTSADGKTISNDCSACHELLAFGEEKPKILTDLGVK
jgi:nitrate/TMAO reductase-like tetraheme cytochrome c subunit